MRIISTRFKARVCRLPVCLTVIIYIITHNANFFKYQKICFTRFFEFFQKKLEIISTLCYNPFVTLLGCRQAVRHSTLTAAFVSSNLATPARKKHLQRASAFFNVICSLGSSGICLPHKRNILGILSSTKLTCG